MRPVRECLGRQLVERSCRIRRLDTHELAVSPEPDLGDARVADELGGSSHADDLAASEHRDAVGELLRLVEVVRREENRRAERAKRADHVPGGSACCRVESRGRLVQEHELGISDERDTEVESSLLPAGERLDARVALLARARRARSPRRRHAGRCSSRRTSRASRAPSGAGSARTAGARRRSARGAPPAPRPDRAPAPSLRLRPALGTPRGSPRSSSCRRRWARAGRRPLLRRPRS